VNDANDEKTELEELTWLEDGRRVSFTLDEEIYPREAILGAAYLFVDRCFVFLNRPGDKQIEVRLKCKNSTSAEALEQMAGDFANSLLDQVVRFHVSERTGRLREYTMARAFFTTPAQASIDQLLAELDAEEMMEDDLEIAVPWQNSGDESGA
jgi:His-Xaa-Ser system protein HxsD